MLNLPDLARAKWGVAPPHYSTEATVKVLGHLLRWLCMFCFQMFVEILGERVISLLVMVILS